MDGEWSDLHLHRASGHDRVRVFRGSPHCQRRHLSFGGRTELRARPRAHEARHEVDPGLKVLRPSQVEVEKPVHHQAGLEAKNHGLAHLEGAAARGNFGVHQTCDVKRDLSCTCCRHNMCDLCHTNLQIALLTSRLLLLLVMTPQVALTKEHYQKVAVIFHEQKWTCMLSRVRRVRRAKPS